MNQDDFICKKCGNRMKLFFIRGFVSLFGGIALLLAAVILFIPTQLPMWLGYILVIASAMTVLSTLRIRCLNCEPEWKTRMWGKP
jgi:uncharacterized paraquat-inducible protein A